MVAYRTTRSYVGRYFQTHRRAWTREHTGMLASGVNHHQILHRIDIQSSCARVRGILYPLDAIDWRPLVVLVTDGVHGCDGRNLSVLGRDAMDQTKHFRSPRATHVRNTWKACGVEATCGGDQSLRNTSSGWTRLARGHVLTKTGTGRKGNVFVR